MINIRPNQMFGQWKVLHRDGKIASNNAWLCECTCGNQRRIRATNLKLGSSSKCMSCRRQKHGHCKIKRSRTYSSWSSMIQRCTNPKYKFYFRYGGRGISVCDRWSNFQNFLTDMGERPIDTSLDRIDPQGGYVLSNCRWATRSQQNKNQRKALAIESFSDEILLAEIVRRNILVAA